MTTNRPRFRHLLTTPVGIATLAVASFAAQFPSLATAAGADALVARSVCEAHELRALKEENPDLEIEIPKEFDTPWPSRDACLSHAAALDEDTPGLVQPIPFSHKHHAGKFGIDCQYCHSGTDRSAAAGVPSVETCMGCHLQFPASYDELSGIRTLKEHWEKQEPIEWLQVHRLPEHVQFRHNRHLQAEPAVELPGVPWTRRGIRQDFRVQRYEVVALGAAHPDARDGLVRSMSPREESFTGLLHLPLLGVADWETPGDRDQCPKSIAAIF